VSQQGQDVAISQEPTPIILDVDTGIDDAVAIALACLSPRSDLVAVTTVAGNTSIENATQNSLDVLDMLGYSRVPLYRGASRPLARPLQTAAYLHGSNGIGGAVLPVSKRQPGEYKGPASFVRMALERPGELTLVCCGPLTNLAIALNVQPDLPALLKSVVVMGGAYSVEGNITESAEFNFHCDPEAASQVFDAPFPDLVAVGLDLTHRVGMSRATWRAAGQLNNPIAMLLHDAFAGPFSDEAVHEQYIHDVLTVATALDPTLVKTEDHHVSIHAGFDERGASRLGPLATAKIGVDVDRNRFFRELETLFGLGF